MKPSEGQTPKGPPKELEEAMLCQKMFSPLDEKTAYHYKLDLYSDEFKHELKGLWASADKPPLKGHSRANGEKSPREKCKISNDVGEGVPLPLPVSYIYWKCLRCDVYYTIETVNPFKADKCPVCLKMDRITLIDYHSK